MTLPPTLLPQTLDSGESPDKKAHQQQLPGAEALCVFELKNMEDTNRNKTFTPAQEICIGRDKATCELFYPDCLQLSRQHCKIFSMGRDVFALDKSSNGTWVNQKLVGRGNQRGLRDGDVVSLLRPSDPDSAKFSWKFVAPESEKGSGMELTSGVHSVCELGKVLGTGNFATVRLGKMKKSGKLVAVKIIEKKKFALSQSDFSFSGLQSEVDILRKMNHRNIINIVDVFDEPKTFTMLLELVEGGDLFDYIVGRCPHPFTEDEAKLLFAQLVEALIYMHSRNVVHRDLKPENILVHVDPAFPLPHKGTTDDHQHLAKSVPVDKVTMKITDFGLAKFCAEQSVMTTMCGTPSYLAPEVLIPSPHSTKTSQGYQWGVDVWSLGVILYILLSGTPPANPAQGNVQFGKTFAGISEVAKDLVLQMLHVDPNKRACLESIVNHEWLKGLTIEGRALAMKNRKHERPQLEGTVLIKPNPTLTDIVVDILPTPTVEKDGKNGVAKTSSTPAAEKQSVISTSQDGAAVATATPAVAPSTVSPKKKALSSKNKTSASMVSTATDTEANGNDSQTEKGSSDDEATDGNRAPPKRRKVEPCSSVRWFWCRDLGKYKSLGSRDGPADKTMACFQAYNDEDCKVIETNYKKANAKSSKIPSTENYRISFEGMFQYAVADNTKQREVRRVKE